ncbi:MAG: DUF5690 family protein [Blastocatellia bacterium]|jgi:hypothetical protein
MTTSPDRIPQALPPLHTRDSWRRSIWAVAAAFGAYFCMYGFRKPFTAASFEEAGLVWGMGYKSVAVIAQVMGYMVSKFIGIRIVSEMEPRRRVPVLLLLVGCAEAALLLHALLPAPWNLAALFLNGLPLGMVFGLVLGFLEGRRMTEALTAGLCASFIVADGVSKSVGAWLLTHGVETHWMPFVAGLVFAPSLLIFAWMLTRIPPPDHADIAARCERLPMQRLDRRRLLMRYAPGLCLLIGSYLCLTILRSLRADFAPEIWQGLGYRGQPSIFTQSELLVMVGVVSLNGLAVFIHDNRRAFFAALGAACLGFLLAATGLMAWAGTSTAPAPSAEAGFGLMVLLGLGLYLPYVAIHTTLFERFLAMTGERGNLGYLMYLADSVGYLGYVVVMLGRERWMVDENFLPFFLDLALLLIVIAAGLLIVGWYYFRHQGRVETRLEEGREESHEAAV